MRASSGRVHDRVAAADRCGPSGSATPRRPPHRTRARKSPQLYSTLLCPLCDSRRGPAAWCLAPRLGGSGLARARGGRRAARLSRPTRRLGRARSRSFQLSLSTYFSLYPRPARPQGEHVALVRIMLWALHTVCGVPTTTWPLPGGGTSPLVRTSWLSPPEQRKAPQPGRSAWPPP